jgi:hypothetical protein
MDGNSSWCPEMINNTLSSLQWECKEKCSNKAAAFQTMIWLQGFALNCIGPHSICASGTMMALYLNSVSTVSNKFASPLPVAGRKSKTWMTYIHTHIAVVSASIALVMAQSPLCITQKSPLCITQDFGPDLITTTNKKASTAKNRR